MKKNRIIISSPLQLLNGFEYFKHSKYFVDVINLGNDNNLNTIVNVCERLSLNYNVYSSFLKKKSYLISSLIIICKLLPVVLRSKKILIGDFREFHYKFLLFLLKILKIPIVLLDDGNSTFFYKDEILRLSNTNKNLEIFSLYDIGQSEVLNQFKFLKGIYFKSKVSNFDIFIGSSVVQNNAMSEKHYMNLLMNYPGNKLKSFYIPHRNESPEQLQKIVNLGFIVINLNLPIELYVLNGIGINSIHSLCSSAVINIDLLYSNITINLYIVGDKWVNSKMGYKMKNIELKYKFLVDNGNFNNSVNFLESKN